MDTEELNRKIKNDAFNIDSLKGFEIICESMVYKILDIFGKNMLLSMLYQIGSGPGVTIAERIKRYYNKEDFEVQEAVELLFKELYQFYSIQIKFIQQTENFTKFTLENHCFLREPIKNREKLDFGKALCRVNKGYFETAFKSLLREKISKVEINFLYNDEEKNACVEELIFYHK